MIYLLWILHEVLSENRKGTIMEEEQDRIYILFIIQSIYDDEFPVMASFDEEKLEEKKEYFMRQDFVSACRIEAIDFIPS